MIKEKDMKKVLVGFNDANLLKAISKAVNAGDGESLEFITRRNKAAVLAAIEDGICDVVLLTEECGREKWTSDELIKIKDSFHINLIPILSDSYYGEDVMKDYLSVGITSIVFLKKGGIYKTDEIVRMIYRERTPKDARTYYGIESMSDYGDNPLDEVSFENARRTLAGAPDDLIGQKLLDGIGRFTPSQTATFLKTLDEDILFRLADTLEYYDVLEILKKSGVVESYPIPKEIKKRQKERQKELRRKRKEKVSAKDTDTGEEVVYAPQVVYEGSYREIDEEDEEDMADSAEIEDFEANSGEGHPSFAEDDEESEDAAEGIITRGNEFSFEGGEPEQSLEKEVKAPAREMPAGDEFSFAGVSSDTGESDMKEEIKEETRRAPEKEKPQKKEAGKKEKMRNTAPRSKRLTIEDIRDEEEEKVDKKYIGIVALVVVAAAVFLVVLGTLFVRITMRRRFEQAQRDTSGYDQQYSPEEVATYGLTENGSPVLYDEEGNVLYDGSDPTNNVVTPEEDIDFTIANEFEEEPQEVVNQQYNDTAAYENGKQYKGLDLVNMLNGNQGANCVLKMRNGMEVEVTRGDASIEEFKPSSFYQCEINGTELFFVEQ